MSETTSRSSPKVRERAARMVLNHESWQGSRLGR